MRGRHPTVPKTRIFVNSAYKQSQNQQSFPKQSINANPEENHTVVINLGTDQFDEHAPAIQVLIQEKEHTAVLDSGAYVSIINKETAKGAYVIPNKKITLKSLSNTIIQNYGVALVNMKIGDAEILYPFVIVDYQVDLLLGWDFAETFGVNIQTNGRRITSLTFGEAPIISERQDVLKKLDLYKYVRVTKLRMDTHFQTEENQQNEPIYASIRRVKNNHNYHWSLRVAERTELPPRTEVFIKIKNEGLLPDTFAVINPSPKLFRRNGLLLPNMLISNTTTYVSIINATNHRRILCRETVLGKLSNYVGPDDLIPLPGSPHPMKSVKIRSIRRSNESEKEIRDQHAQTFKISDTISKETRSELLDLLYEYHDIFSWSEADNGNVTAVKFRIETGDHPPIVVRGRPLSEGEYQMIDEHVESLLKNGVICRSQSPWSTWGFLVPQEDENGDRKFRCVFDFRRLNKITKPLRFPLPRIQDILHNLRDAKYITTADLRGAFHQLEVHDDSKEKTGFSTRKGHYHFLKLPFGLTNAAVAFQQLMKTMVSGLNSSVICCYIDDMIIATKTQAEHLEHLRSLFERLREFGLRLKPTKCNWMFPELRVLGFATSSTGIRLTQSQIDGVLKLRIPRTKKEVQKVLGLFNYYRRWIRNYGIIAAPINKLLSLGHKEKLVWGNEQNEAFERLKALISRPPILSHYRPNTTGAIISSDAALTGIGATLSQVTSDGSVKPCAYISRALTNAEKKMSVTEMETLGIAYALKSFRHLVYMEPIDLITDHSPLCFLVKSDKENIDLSPRLVRMLLYIRQYDIRSIKHVQGKLHTVCDALSRMPCDPAPDEEEEIYLAVNSIHSAKTQSSSMGHPISAHFNSYMSPNDSASSSTENDSTLPNNEHVTLYNPDEIRKEQEADQECIAIKEQIMKGETTGFIKHCFVTNGIILYKKPDMPDPVVYLPKSLRLAILEEAHDGLLSMHPGITKTYERIASRYFFKNIRKCIKGYLQSCDLCQKTKALRQKPQGLIQMTTVPLRPFQSIQMDIVGPLPRSLKNHKYMITVSCVATRYIVLAPLREATSEQIAKFLVESVILKYGCVENIHTDLATNFTSEIMKDVVKYLGVTHHTSSGYNWRFVAITERSHDVLNQKIRAFASEKLNDWCKYIPYIQHAINTMPNETTGYSSFYLLHGYDITLPLQTTYGMKRPAVLQEIHDRMNEARIIAQSEILDKQLEQAERHDKKRRHSSYKIGAQVLVQRFSKQGLPKKLQIIYNGPMTVIAQSDVVEVNYLIEWKRKNKKQRFWTHVERMRPYYARDYDKLGLSSEQEKVDTVINTRENIAQFDANANPHHLDASTFSLTPSKTLHNNRMKYDRQNSADNHNMTATSVNTLSKRKKKNSQRRKPLSMRQLDDDDTSDTESASSDLNDDDDKNARSHAHSQTSVVNETLNSQKNIPNKKRVGQSILKQQTQQKHTLKKNLPKVRFDTLKSSSSDSSDKEEVFHNYKLRKRTVTKYSK